MGMHPQECDDLDDGTDDLLIKSRAQKHISDAPTKSKRRKAEAGPKPSRAAQPPTPEVRAACGVTADNTSTSCMLSSFDAHVDGVGRLLHNHA